MDTGFGIQGRVHDITLMVGGAGHALEPFSSETFTKGGRSSSEEGEGGGETKEERWWEAKWQLYTNIFCFEIETAALLSPSPNNPGRFIPPLPHHPTDPKVGRGEERGRDKKDLGPS